MNNKDQRLIAEAYNKVLEAAPVGLFSRIGSRIKAKAQQIIPFTGESGKVETEMKEKINNAKTRFQTLYRLRYGEKYNAKRATDSELIISFLRREFGLDDASQVIVDLKSKNWLTDEDINNAIIQGYVEHQTSPRKRRQQQQP
jgi:hypothetical protein